jgi:hypothetical protein
MAFPGRPPVSSTTLSRNPIDETFEYLEEKIENSTDGMYTSTRSFNTRHRKVITITYDLLPAADITKITNHYDTVGTGDTFAWVDRASNSYTVKYNKPPKWKFAVEGYYALEALIFVEQ